MKFTSRAGQSVMLWYFITAPRTLNRQHENVWTRFSCCCFRGFRFIFTGYSWPTVTETIKTEPMVERNHLSSTERIRAWALLPRSAPHSSSQVTWAGRMSGLDRWGARTPFSEPPIPCAQNSRRKGEGGGEEWEIVPFLVPLFYKVLLTLSTTWVTGKQGLLSWTSLLLHSVVSARWHFLWENIPFTFSFFIASKFHTCL